MQNHSIFASQVANAAVVAPSPRQVPASGTSLKRVGLYAVASIMLVSAQVAGAAACDWVAAGLPENSNFDYGLNWDAVPSPAADLSFGAGSAFASKPNPVNNYPALDPAMALNAIYLYEAYNITGNAITCHIIRNFASANATVNLPIGTEGSAALTITVDVAGNTLYLPGLLSGTGPATYSGPGITRLNGSVNNTLSGLTSVAGGNLELASTAAESIAGPVIIDVSAIVTLLNAPEIKNTAAVTVNGNLNLSLATGNDGADTETIGGLSGNGAITLGANTLGCTAQAGPTDFAGGFSGTGGFRQSVSGIQILSGTSSHTGATTLAGGELHIRGSQATSPVNVTSGTLVLANDSLVGDVTLSGGAASTLSCYDPLTAMNLHSTATSLTIGAGSTYQIEVRGSPATLYTNVTTAAATLTGAVLTVNTTTYTPGAGAVLTIIDNTGGAAVTGIFAGLVEGATVVSTNDAAIAFAISYIGGTGNDVTLLRIGLDATAPVISAVTASSLTNSSAAITWTTDEASTSRIAYGLSTAYSNTTSADPALVLSHGTAITGLAASTLYHYQVHSTDASGNPATGVDNTFTTTATADLTAPVISAVVAGALTMTSTVITWTTDEASNSQVEYGPTAAYGTTTSLAAALILTHSVPISGLTAATIYHFRVLSTDAAANPATGVDGTFTTAAAPVAGVAAAAINEDDNGKCGFGSALALLAMALLAALRLQSPGRRKLGA